MRVAIHPVDMRAPRTRQSLATLLPRLCERHEVMSYDTFLSQRLSDPSVAGP
jgi:hypothetical protein